MTEKDLKKTAKSFRSRYNLKTVSYDSLFDVAEKKGFTVIEFSRISSDKNVAVLISELNLSEFIIKAKGFTFVDPDFRLVFINEDLSDDEKTIVLAHELGHIELCHYGTANIIGNDVKEEYEANEFAHFLLSENTGFDMESFIFKYKKQIIAVLSVLVVSLSILFVYVSFTDRNNNRNDTTEYYITVTGSKYHRADCVFVKNKSNVRPITVEQIKTSRYEPCKVCLPDLIQ